MSEADLFGLPGTATLYDVLEVSPRASAPVIKAAYRCLAQIYHPDKNPGDAAASDRLTQIIRAYKLLNNPEQRARYDVLLSQQAKRLERRGRPSPAAARAHDAEAKPSERRFAFRPLK